MTPTPSPGYKPIGGPDDPRHGTEGGYTNYRCRCDRCRAAHRVANRPRAERWRRRQGMLPVEERRALRVAAALPCGTHAAYVRHRRNGEEPCRACRDGEAAYKRRQRAAKSADAQTDERTTAA